MTQAAVPESELPEGWTLTTLQDVTQQVPNVKPETEPDRVFGYVDISSICNKTNRIAEHKTFSGRDAPSRARRPIQTSDVLFSNVRTYLRNVAIVEPNVEVDLCSTGFTVLRSNGAIDPHFLFRYVLTDQFIDAVTPQQTGTHYPATTDRVVLGQPMPLAPLAEQRRIVAKVEALIARVQATLHRLAHVPTILSRFRHAILAAACDGRLTADWRDDFTSVDENSRHKALAHHRQCWEQRELLRLRESGRQPKSDAWKAKYAAPEFGDEPLRELPVGWTWVPLGLLGADPLNPVQTGPFGAQLHRDEFVESGVPVIAVGNLTGMGFTSNGLYFVPPEKAEQLARYDVNAGDILFARSGATLGKVCVAPAFVDNWRMTGHILRARLNRDFILPDYAVFALHGDPDVVGQVMGNVRGVTRPGFNTALLEVTYLPLPPLAEQHEIVRRVESLFKLVDAIDRRVASATRRAEKLTQAILGKAFRGELVPQDPNDEAATVLLERIRTLKSAKASKVKRGATAGPGKTTKKAEGIMITRKDIQDDHLATILKQRGPLTAESLWSASQLDIDEFYDQLKAEEQQGLVKERRGDSSTEIRLLEIT